jgi:hypothetical protein
MLLALNDTRVRANDVLTGLGFRSFNLMTDGMP